MRRKYRSFRLCPSFCNQTSQSAAFWAAKPSSRSFSTAKLCLLMACSKEQASSWACPSSTPASMSSRSKRSAWRKSLLPPAAPRLLRSDFSLCPRSKDALSAAFSAHCSHSVWRAPYSWIRQQPGQIPFGFAKGRLLSNSFPVKRCTSSHRLPFPVMPTHAAHALETDSTASYFFCLS